MHDKLFWKQRIIEYIASRTKYVTHITYGSEIEDQFTGHIDPNYHPALDELIRDGIVEKFEQDGKIGHSLDVEKHRDKIIYLLRADNDEHKAALIKPTIQEFKGLILKFNNASERKYPNQGIYYYCVKEADPTCWIVLIKHTPSKKAMRVILGSFDDKESRLSRIWAATKLAWKLYGESPIVRKNVEDLEQKACGNNRIPSKCAFDIFVHIGRLRIDGQKGLSKQYKMIQLKNYS